ncbi:hypothetical protein PIROE2DRAFT_42288, partial [Piromyces sp. E2]
CLTPECYEASKNILTKMDITVNPCEDFYQFVCGTYMRETEIPSNKSRIDAFDETSEKNIEILHNILEGEYPVNNNLSQEDQEIDKKIFNKLKTYYNMCMDKDTIDKKGKEPLMKFLNNFDLYANKSKYESVDGFTNLMIDLHYYGMYPFFTILIDSDFENPSLYAINLNQSELPLSKTQYKNKEIVSNYKIAIKDTLNLLFGDQPNKRNIEEMTNTIVDLELKLFDILIPPEDLQNPFKIYNKSNIGELMKEYPYINWMLYFSKRFDTYKVNTPVNDDTFIINGTPKYFEELKKIFEETDLDSLLTYIEWKIISYFISDIADEFNEPLKKFNRIINGIEEEKPRYKNCIDDTETVMGKALGRYYIEKAFEGDSKTNAEEVIDYIKEAMINRIPKMTWLDKETSEYAIKKVKIMPTKIGYPDDILNPKKLEEDYEDLIIDPEDIFTTNVNFGIFAIKENIKKLNKKVDFNEWYMTPQTVNAYYYPLDNSINFPAGILQPPFFNAKIPDYLNYGGIGMVVGHELTHAFDSNGSQFDSSGKLFNWWSNSTLSEFSNLSKCFVEQYDQYTVKDKDGKDIHLNGALTINENLADNGGISRAYEAWNLFRKDAKKFSERNKQLPGLSDYTFDQLFYISFGQIWCQNVRPEYLADYVTTNYHSPAKYRVNGVLSNSKHFAETFNCPKNSPMNPDNKCLIW